MVLVGFYNQAMTVGRHKKGKHSLSDPIPVQDSGMPQGEPSMDPMCAEVTAVVNSWVEVQGRKKAKLAASVLVITSLPSSVCASSNIVHHDITMVENKDVNKGRRQYITHSKVGKSLAADTTAIFIGRDSGFKSGVVSKIVERLEDSDPSTPSL
ncbi:hypothetical protein H0E87_002002 [Populus deltoides]|uniref:Uncharacterized protein n=1 Tax=Populus deltoides TaxID=3696 RepID=A0A8T2ZT95_POPDE|nr:hypothetical protein H0E87_002002 [Populus deltoides]